MSIDSPPITPEAADPEDEPTETRSSRRRTRKADKVGPGLLTRARQGAGKALQSTRKLTVDWLDRPMTSLHLILAIFALMLGFGLLMVLSSSSVAAFRIGGSSFSVFINQATYAAVGLVFFWAAQYIPVRVLRSLSTIAVMISLLLLVAVLLPGIGALVNGSRSWIRVGGFQFQPSEIAKLALLLWMAHVLAARRSTLGSPKALLIPVLPVYVLMAGLIMLQPDLGTTVALTIVFMAVLFFAGAPWWTFASLAAAGVAAFFYLAISADYRLARLLSFINPEAHPDSSYQLLQSLYGLGNGGWFGVGLGQSRAKWSYLPNADSDFIFAIIGEELGLIGAGVLLLLFALLAYTGLRIARRNVDPFVKIVASGCTVWLVGQAGINIGYVVGLLPVTGIPLPMISSGGTSLLITMVVFGLLANFARRETQAAAALQAGGGNRLARFLGIGSADPSGRRAARRRQRGNAANNGAAQRKKAKTGPGQRQTRPAAAEPQRRGQPGAAGPEAPRPVRRVVRTNPAQPDPTRRNPERATPNQARSNRVTASQTRSTQPGAKQPGANQHPNGRQRRPAQQPANPRSAREPVDPRPRRSRWDGA
ncbi:MAG: putative lipid II flippase FtsW [Nakamurella sp.]